jgi:hypothetical protein
VRVKFATGLDACETEPKRKSQVGIRAVLAEANAQAALPSPINVLRHERQVQVSSYLVELGINAGAVDGRFDIVPPVSKWTNPSWVSETKQLQTLDIVGKPIHLIRPLSWEQVKRFQRPSTRNTWSPTASRRTSGLDVNLPTPCRNPSGYKQRKQVHNSLTRTEICACRNMGMHDCRETARSHTLSALSHQAQRQPVHNQPSLCSANTGSFPIASTLTTCQPWHEPTHC